MADMRTEVRRRERRRTVGLVGGLLALTLTVAGCGVLAARMTFGNLFDFDFDFDLGDIDTRSVAGAYDPRDHPPLAPIPVDPASCAYLAPVRATTSELLTLWSNHLPNRPMEPFRQALDPKLAAFVLQLRNAEAHVPAAVAERLRTVIWHVEVGRGEMKTASDPAQFALQPDGSLAQGLGALLDASDLVGTACGPPLYPAT